jgi:TRAP-type C4-dicarboxylate transport system permease small subunit
MFGSSSRTGQRSEPTWTQAPAGASSPEPAWHDSESTRAIREPSRIQGRAQRVSQGRGWLTLALVVLGLLVVAYLLMRMFDVVQEQVARNRPDASPAAVDLMPAHGTGQSVSGTVK